MEKGEQDLGDFKVGSLPTVIYIPSFITESEQTQLLDHIYESPISKWKSLKNRRLQNWGGVVHEKGLLPQALPPWLTKITQRICEHTGLFPSAINHVLINEYLPDQGIMPHQDGPAYFPVVAILSLGCPAVMNFTPHSKLRACTEGTKPNDTDAVSDALKEENEKERCSELHHPSVLLMPCSLLIFKDEAYSDYLHGIEDSDVHRLNNVVNVEAMKHHKDIFLPESEDAGGIQNTEQLKSIHRTSTRVSLTCRQINSTRRNLGYLSCGTGNPIDDCWRCDRNWHKNRKRLADCAIGFGKQAIGGRDGRIYVVTDSGNDNPVTPKPGTLRYAVIQEEPLWIIFQHDMVIKLKEELIMNSFKTIDGRGANVHIAGGPCITIQYVSNIIIHGINIHDCKQGGNTNVRDSTKHFGFRTLSDGDGVSIFGGSHVWVDHCSLSNCRDGLIDAIHGSTAITISNNYMTHHDKVMLLGHRDDYVRDKMMQVTIAFNHFGEGLVQRMPRCRHGYFHVVNNDYTHWEMYAIGGSAAPTINSQGNRFLAPNRMDNKEVTKHEDTPESEWKHWNWRSEGDLMLNGAFFTPSGKGASSSYAKASSLGARPSSLVGSLTSSSGVLNCRQGSRC